MKILLLAHDVSDAAVHKRVAMLRIGGADVSVAGFRRTPRPVLHVGDTPPTDFGRTFDGFFLQRIFTVLREVLFIGRRNSLFQNCDVIIARNLEMLAIAVTGRACCGNKKPKIIYECLDIHRLVLNKGIVGTWLRNLEGWLSKRASTLFTSSPAFVQNYFEPLSQIQLPVRIIENKILDADQNIETPNQSRQATEPWVIGWFGIIRCRKSLDILAELVQHNAGKIKVIIRGRPALDQFDDFHAIIANTPGLEFGGVYTATELPALYRDVHFSWAIDMYEEGQNSAWLLPNRLYEGCAHHAVPIALDNVETGTWLKRHNIGIVLSLPLAQSLSRFFNKITSQQYAMLEKAVMNVSRDTWIADRKECVELVDYLRSVKDPLNA
ncbi:MAG: glycosyl transferase family 1 [Alphaproteobacteria bacterium]